MDILTQSVTYLTATRFERPRGSFDDYTNIPRPLFALAYIISGEALFTSDGMETPVSTGDLIFIPYGSRYISYWNGNPSTKFLTWHFNFSSQAAHIRTRSFPLQAIRGIGDTLDDFLYVYAHMNDPDEFLSVIARFYSVCDRVFRRLYSKELPPIDERLEKALEYMERNCSSPITVEELAQISYLSTPHFYACFRRQMGVSPIVYKNRIRTEKAIQLLIADFRKPVEEISKELGFESVIYFRRLFKSVTGFTPREYRAKIQKGLYPT